MQILGGRLLLVDGDVELCHSLRKRLAEDGFVVESAHSGMEGLNAILRGGFDLVLLDVRIPGLDGFTLLSLVRPRTAVPIMMLTARNDHASLVTGLTRGADDYLAKPFEPEVLTAKIRAILRRSSATPFDPLATISIGPVILDPHDRTVRIDGTPAKLTCAEFNILEMLVRAAGHLVPREAIGQRLYQREISRQDRSIEVHISSIRRKLGPQRELVKTIWGRGYMFSAVDLSTVRTPSPAKSRSCNGP